MGSFLRHFDTYKTVLASTSIYILSTYIIDFEPARARAGRVVCQCVYQSINNTVVWKQNRIERIEKKKEEEEKETCVICNDSFYPPYRLFFGWFMYAFFFFSESFESVQQRVCGAAQLPRWWWCLLLAAVVCAEQDWLDLTWVSWELWANPWLAWFGLVWLWDEGEMGDGDGDGTYLGN